MVTSGSLFYFCFLHFSYWVWPFGSPQKSEFSFLEECTTIPLDRYKIGKNLLTTWPKIAPIGIAGGRIMVVDKMHFAQALREGKVDLFHDSVVPTMVLSKWSGSVPILRQWKYGEADYSGIIVVTKDSDINTLADLKGKVIGFDEPHSTSASVLPRMLLEEQKLKLVEVKSPRSVKPDAVGYVYGTDGSSLNFLVTGRGGCGCGIK